MKRNKTYNTLILTIFITVSTHLNALDIIPRVGVAAGILWTEDNIATTLDNENGDSFTYGPNGGVVLISKDNFFDISFDLLKYDTGTKVGIVDANMPNSGWRSETTYTLGHRIFSTLYLMAGHRDVTWGETAFSNEGTYQKGEFIGISLNNMEIDKDLVSVSVAQYMGEYSSLEGNADAQGAFFKISWREKGSKNLWSVKYSEVGSLINDIPLTVGYTRLFY